MLGRGPNGFSPSSTCCIDYLPFGTVSLLPIGPLPRTLNLHWARSRHLQLREMSISHLSLQISLSKSHVWPNFSPQKSCVPSHSVPHLLKFSLASSMSQTIFSLLVASSRDSHFSPSRPASPYALDASRRQVQSKLETVHLPCSEAKNVAVKG